ncbi:hypothetical protein COOONC_27427 [Cooperia oncophora]
MIPEEFLDTHFVESKEEHLEDFLAVRGVPWLVRKMISGKLRKGQFLMKQNPDGGYILLLYTAVTKYQKDGELWARVLLCFVQKSVTAFYSYTTGDPSRNLQYRFKLGETFTDTGYDGKQHKITITMDGDKLKEVHLNLERDVGEDAFYFFFQNGVLVSVGRYFIDNSSS